MIARISLAGAIGSAIAFGALIAGCSSGGSGSTAPQMPTVAATALSTGSSGTLSSTKTAAVNVSIPITQKSATASSRRNPAFVSPGADYVAFTAQPGSVDVGDVQCTQSACTGTLQVPVATTSITAKITDSGGVLLAIATQAVTINPGQANTVNFVFNGVVTNFEVSLPASQQFVVAVPTSVPATITAYDASGNQITTAGNLIDASQNVLVSADGTTQTMSLVPSTTHVTASALSWSSSSYTLTGTVAYDGASTGSPVLLVPTSSVHGAYAYDEASVPENPKQLEVFANPTYTIPYITSLSGTGSIFAYQVEPQTTPFPTLVEFPVVPTPGPVQVELNVMANFNDAGATLTLSNDTCSNQIYSGLGTDGSLQSALPSPGPTMPAGGSFPLAFPAGTYYSAAPAYGACSFTVNDTTNGIAATTTLGFDQNQLYVQGRSRK